jgi:excisionase family DNA binding protein
MRCRAPLQPRHRTGMSGSYPHLSEILPQLALPDEVAPLLGLTPLGVVRQCRQGKLPGVKIGNRWLIHVAKLAEQLDRKACSSAGAPT